MIPLTREQARVRADVHAERNKQDLKWGVQNHPSVPNVARKNPNAFIGIPSADYLKARCDLAHAMDKDSWALILAEEFAEAIEACGEGHTTADLRAELIQVAAVACAWVECLDRNGDVVGSGIFRRVRR